MTTGWLACTRLKTLKTHSYERKREEEGREKKNGQNIRIEMKINQTVNLFGNIYFGSIQ